MKCWCKCICRKTIVGHRRRSRVLREGGFFPWSLRLHEEWRSGNTFGAEQRLVLCWTNGALWYWRQPCELYQSGHDIDLQVAEAIDDSELVPTD